MISAPPVDGSSNELCDWLELAVLSSKTSKASLQEVNSEIEIDSDFEPSDFSAENEKQERRVQKVVNAIEERCQSMGNSYPFERIGQIFALRSEITEGGFAYLFCLVVSNAANGGLLDGNAAWQPDMKEARNLFQVCATVSAAGYTDGPSYSLGWPRDDSSSFLVKLREIYGHFGDGRPHAAMPSHGPRDVKDDDVDVVSWREEMDKKPGTLYLLLQAASGANWESKSLIGIIDRFHSTWFVQPPASQALAGIAVPFVLPSKFDADEDDHERQEKIA